MKKIALILSCFLTLSAMSSSVHATTDIKDLLKNAAGSLQKGNNGSDQSDGSGSTSLSALKGLVEGVISKSDLTEADLTGEWKYSAPAVTFKSDNLLKKAGGAAAAGVIADKIAPYYAKAGINQLTATFNEDKTFTFKIRQISLSGTFEKDAASETGDFIFRFKAANKISLGKFNAHVEKAGRKLTITFDASRLINLVNTVASASGHGTLKSVAAMLNSYDGLNCGFELTPVSE